MIAQTLDATVAQAIALARALAVVGHFAFDAAMLMAEHVRIAGSAVIRRHALHAHVPGRVANATVAAALLDANELVTRPTGRYLKRIPGVAGIGLLGNGSVIPLLDVAELARSPRDHAMRAAAEARSQARAQRRSRVLVVDDSMSVRRSVATLLEDQGYDIALARDGLEAVKAMEASRPDVLLTDLEMPNMNGLELTAHVRSRAELAHLPVIMITSRSMDKHRRQAMSTGVDVYLTKPYTDQELLQHVATAVTGRVERRVAAG